MQYEFSLIVFDLIYNIYWSEYKKKIKNLRTNFKHKKTISKDLFLFNFNLNILNEVSHYAHARSHLHECKFFHPSLKETCFTFTILSFCSTRIYARPLV